MFVFFPQKDPSFFTVAAPGSDIEADNSEASQPGGQPEAAMDTDSNQEPPLVVAPAGAVVSHVRVDSESSAGAVADEPPVAAAAAAAGDEAQAGQASAAAGNPGDANEGEQSDMDLYLFAETESDSENEGNAADGPDANASAPQQGRRKRSTICHW